MLLAAFAKTEPRGRVTQRGANAIVILNDRKTDDPLKEVRDTMKSQDAFIENFEGVIQAYGPISLESNGRVALRSLGDFLVTRIYYLRTKTYRRLVSPSSQARKPAWSSAFESIEIGHLLDQCGNFGKIARTTTTCSRSRAICYEVKRILQSFMDSPPANPGGPQSIAEIAPSRFGVPYITNPSVSDWRFVVGESVDERRGEQGSSGLQISTGKLVRRRRLELRTR